MSAYGVPLRVVFTTPPLGRANRCVSLQTYASPAGSTKRLDPVATLLLLRPGA